MELELHIRMNNHLFLRNPEQSEIGKNILSGSVNLIDRIGFEDFTFKKLANEIGSTEATIYRYFENKYRLLTYLVSWYWNWLEYMIVFETHMMQDAKEKIEMILKLLTFHFEEDMIFEKMNPSKLCKVVVAEGAKSFFNKSVDSDYKDLIFKPYDDLCSRISGVFSEFFSNYTYAKNFAITLIETSHFQFFMSEHLPSYTQISSIDHAKKTQIYNYLHHLVFAVLR